MKQRVFRSSDNFPGLQNRRNSKNIGIKTIADIPSIEDHNMKSITTTLSLILGFSSLICTVLNLISASRMPECAGLGALAKEGSGVGYIGIGIVILLILSFLKKKSII